MLISKTTFFGGVPIENSLFWYCNRFSKDSAASFYHAHSKKSLVQPSLLSENVFFSELFWLFHPRMAEASGIFTTPSTNRSGTNAFGTR
jgi:hypothetical protein